jgi:hypothetical protein
LKLAGLVKRDLDGFLVVRNRIYARLFDRHWVEGARARLSQRLAELEARLHERERLAALGITITVDAKRSGNEARFRLVSQEAFKEAVPLLKAVEPIVSLHFESLSISDILVLAGLGQLQSLDLSFTRVSDISVLAGLIRLRELDLRGTLVTAEAVARLREWLAARGNRFVRITRGGRLAAAVDYVYLAGRALLRSLWPF